jgi:hypothetical protein
MDAIYFSDEVIYFCIDDLFGFFCFEKKVYVLVQYCCFSAPSYS